MNRQFAQLLLEEPLASMLASMGAEYVLYSIFVAVRGPQRVWPGSAMVPTGNCEEYHGHYIRRVTQQDKWRPLPLQRIRRAGL